jgi:hypothetical protein
MRKLYFIFSIFAVFVRRWEIPVYLYKTYVCVWVGVDVGVGVGVREREWGRGLPARILMFTGSCLDRVCERFDMFDSDELWR